MATIASLVPASPARLRAEAERAARAGDWAAALRAWRAFNATNTAHGRDAPGRGPRRPDAGACRAGRLSLRRAIAADPADPEPWRLLLEILRVEDRTYDAERVVWESYDRVPADSRRDVLRELTLALLARPPEETARTTLDRWIAADPADVEARVGILQRIASQPRRFRPRSPGAGWPSWRAWSPSTPITSGRRGAPVSALADAGEPDRGRAVLDAWPGPESGRDARYWRLLGRWELEYDRHPDGPRPRFRPALEAIPQDWRTWYRLARALRQLGRAAEARRAAEAVGRIRSPSNRLGLGPRLDDDFRHLDDPRALRTSPRSPPWPGCPAWPTPGGRRTRLMPGHHRRDDRARDYLSRRGAPHAPSRILDRRRPLRLGR